MSDQTERVLLSEDEITTKLQERTNAVLQTGRIPTLGKCLPFMLNAARAAQPNVSPEMFDAILHAMAGIVVPAMIFEEMQSKEPGGGVIVDTVSDGVSANDGPRIIVPR